MSKRKRYVVAQKTDRGTYKVLAPMTRNLEQAKALRIRFIKDGYNGTEVLEYRPAPKQA